MTICTIYSNITDDPEVLDHISNELVHWPLPVIICGDYNLNLPSVWSEGSGFKYKGRKPRVFQALNNLCQTHGLIDIWIAEHPNDPGYTHYSYPHACHARLDYFFGL